MQKLYKVAFQKILNKIGADKVENLSFQSLQTLLKQKNIPLSEIDQTLLHKIPRQELKNLLRNPCPITKAQQTSTEAVTSAKAVRASLNIVEKRICFKCPFVSTCDRAFIEPPSDFKIQNPLPNLLFTMKNATQIENNDIYKPRSWFSGVRICDSMNSVLDDLMQGGQQFKIFKHERNILKDEAEAQNQNQQKSKENKLVKQAKKQKIPLKDVYAQVPSSEKQQTQHQKEGQEAFEELSKGPQDIFKKKKSQQFIKIAKKYLNEEGVQNQRKIQKERKQNKKQQKSPNNINKNQNDQNSRENKRQMRGKQRSFQRQDRQGRREQREKFSKGRQSNFRKQGNLREENNYRGERNFREENNFRQQNSRKFDNRQKNRNFRDRDNFDENERYQPRRNDRNRQQPSRYENQRNYQQSSKQRDFNQQEESNPRIKRFSKDRSNQSYQRSQQQPSFSKKNNKFDKFYSQMNERKTDEEEILSSFNKRESQNKSTRLPIDAKQRSHEGRSSPLEFSEKEMKQFDRLQKIPKILKTQFASKQDIQERQQQSSEGEVSEERKGRRVRRS